MSAYELISFSLCPFVQRSVITLKSKNVDFDIKYIDLKEPPQWFLDISPLGKVPVLKVNDTVLFESAVINEYLDEVTGGAYLPSEPLIKAQCRAWIEFASEMLMTQYMATVAKDEAGFKEKLAQMKQQVQRLEGLVQTPFYLGEAFSLVDSSYAPFFMRHAIIEEFLGEDVLSATPKVKQWSDNLLVQDEVKESVLPSFKQDFTDYCNSESSWIVSQ